jgi:putative glutamine amidotransferase
MSAHIMITAGHLKSNDKLYIALIETYASCIEKAGGVPYVGLHGNPGEMASRMDGILFSGGVDVCPACYGEATLFPSVQTDTRRDVPEFALFRTFFARKKPIFGICRGAQLINVALGGSLWQDIPRQCPQCLSHEAGSAPHPVIIERGSRLYSVLGEKVEVNTFHHQSVKCEGKGLKVTARATDGTVEAIEHNHLPVWGVQWHPERMYSMQVLFDEFIESVKIHTFQKGSFS